MVENANGHNLLLQERTPILFDMLSEFGKRIYMPEGIIFQSAQSKKLAKFNASAGIASENIGYSGTGDVTIENLGPMTINMIKKYFHGLDTADVFNYAPPSGDIVLRKKWKTKILNQNPELDNNDESITTPIVCGGLTNGLKIAGDLFINPDDVIIAPDKIWENYYLLFKVRMGAKFVHFPLFNDFLTNFNFEGLDQAIESVQKDKVVLLLNFPNNPTGYTPTNEEMDKIVKIVEKHADKGKKVIVICDDAYYGFFYDDNIYKGSIFSKLSGIHKNVISIKVDGVSKEGYAWGFRIGFITISDYVQDKEVYAVLEQKITACIRSSISSSSRVAQSVFRNAIDDEKYIKEKEKKHRILHDRAEIVKDIVYREKYKEFWDVYPFNSGYFICLRIKGIDAESVRRKALHDYGVGTIALGNDIRVAFSCIEKENLEEIFEILATSISELKNKEKS